MPAPTKRPVERNLLLFVTVIVVTGFALVFAGKAAGTRPVLPGDLDINAATAQQFRAALDIDMPHAQAVVAARLAEHGAQFENVATLHGLKALRGVEINWHPDRLYVRTAGDSFRSFFLGSVVFVVLFWLIHIALRLSASAVDQWLMPMSMLLAGIGLMIVYSTKDPYRDIFTYVNQVRGVVLFGAIAFLVPFTNVYRRLPLHRYGFAYAIGAIALMLLLCALGHGPAGVKIEVFGFQPIEFMKVLLVFFVASYLAERRVSLGASVSRRFIADARDVIPLAVLYFIVLFLFLAVKDLGPAVLLLGTFATMLYLATGRRLYPTVAFVLLVIAGVVGSILHVGFFSTRVLMWLHPWASDEGRAGQLAMGLWGLATGGVPGSGLGLGLPSAVPRSGSDMVFTSVGEEMGLFGGLTVLIAVCVIVWRGFRIARSAVDDFDRFLAAGLTFLLGLQAFVITAGTTGLMPLTGITLPFVSYGSSSLVADFFSLGVILQISRKRLPDDVPRSVPSFYPLAARTTVAVLIGGLLIGVGICRLIWFQAVDSDRTATRLLRIPDADGVVRDHENPRLAVTADQIPRGRILDADGHVLARNPLGPYEDGVAYLCGRPRIYPYGPVGAALVLAAEQPSSSTNPLGCDDILRGYSSPEELLALYRSKDMPGQEAFQGRDARLTIHIGLQRAAEVALAAQAQSHGTGRGAAVAVDVATGSLLAAATYPSFDPNKLTDDTWNALHNGSDPVNPLLNRAFAGVYPPGSAFKLVTATAAFNTGHSGFHASCDHVLYNVHWRFDGKPYSRARITDEAGMPPHGYEDMDNAVRVSCNVYFAQLGIRLGPQAMADAMRSYQLAYRPPLTSIGENLPDCAYGQGADEVTPYEMARVAQAIGDGGTLMPGRFLKDAPTGAGSQVTGGDAARSIRAMMRDVVTSGTAAGVFYGPSRDVAGKTGSAQVASGPTHSWFVGIWPYDRPSIAFACVIEHGGAGRDAAAPVCRAIVEHAAQSPPRRRHAGG